MHGAPSPYLRSMLVVLLGFGLFVLYAQEYLGLSFARLGKVLFANYSYASHLELRDDIVRYQLLQVRAEPVILALGDSIVEGALWPKVCGASVINGGIGGASMGTVFDVMAGWLDRPFDAIIIAAGINDAARVRPTPPQEFRRRLEAVAAKASANTKTVLIATVLPVETSGRLGEAAFDPGLIAAYNEAIRDVAQRPGLRLIDLSQAFGVKDGGPMAAGATLDGVHLTAESYRVWLAAVTGQTAGACAPRG